MIFVCVYNYSILFFFLYIFLRFSMSLVRRWAVRKEQSGATTNNDNSINIIIVKLCIQLSRLHG